MSYVTSAVIVASYIPPEVKTPLTEPRSFGHAEGLGVRLMRESMEASMAEMTTSPCPCCDGTGDASPKTDAQVLAALVSQVPANPGGCSAIDALIGLGYYGNVTAALARLLAAGKLRETSPGNYLPVEA